MTCHPTGNRTEYLYSEDVKSVGAVNGVLVGINEFGLVAAGEVDADTGGEAEDAHPAVTMSTAMAAAGTDPAGPRREITPCTVR